jgi:hypothetical protein
VGLCEVIKLETDAYAGNIDGARAACQEEAAVRELEIAAWDAWQVEAGWIDSAAQGVSGQINEAGLDFLYNCLFNNAARGREAAEETCMGVALDKPEFKPGQVGASCPSPAPGSAVPVEARGSGVVFALMTQPGCPGAGDDPTMTAESCVVLAIERGEAFAEAFQRCANSTSGQQSTGQTGSPSGSEAASQPPPSVAQPPQGPTTDNSRHCAELAAEFERLLSAGLGEALSGIVPFGGLGAPSKPSDNNLDAKLDELAAEMQRLGCPGTR